MTQTILINQPKPGLTTITFNRLDQFHAFNQTMLTELIAALTAIASDSHCRVVMLCSVGKFFSAGADLTEMQASLQQTYEENRQSAALIATLMQQLNNLPQVTIAKIQGPAFGGGVGLVAACDIALANETAFFQLTEVKLGLMPAVISPYVIAAIGARAARRYFLTAEKISATRAYELQLIHQITSADQLDITCTELCATLLRNSPQALRQTKQLIARCASITDPALIADTIDNIATIRASAEGQEGLQAFFAKRDPQWIMSSKG